MRRQNENLGLGSLLEGVDFQYELDTVYSFVNSLFLFAATRSFLHFQFSDLVPDLPPSAGIENLYDRALYIRKILLTIPRSVLVVMRYLFAFLNQ